MKSRQPTADSRQAEMDVIAWGAPFAMDPNERVVFELLAHRSMSITKIVTAPDVTSHLVVTQWTRGNRVLLDSETPLADVMDRLQTSVLHDGQTASIEMRNTHHARLRFAIEAHVQYHSARTS